MLLLACPLSSSMTLNKSITSFMPLVKDYELIMILIKALVSDNIIILCCYMWAYPLLA